jgi:hypothetical protein
VVACRSRVYKTIRELRADAGLQFATTVTLQPFSADDIYIYLEQYRDEIGIAEAAWAPVTDQLVNTPDGVLATALRTPWLLNLAATALNRGRYETADALAACCDTAEIRDLLFGSLIPAAVEATPRTRHSRNYSEQNVQRWLRTLAQHLEQRRTQHSGGTQIALDQIWQLARPRTCVALHAFIGALIVALILAALDFGAIWVARLSLSPVRRPSGLLGFLLTAGPLLRIATMTLALAFLLAVGFDLFRATVGQRRARTAKRFAWRVPGRSRWRRGLMHGLAVGLSVGLLVAIPLVPAAAGGEPTFLVAIEIAFALTLGLGFGLGFGLGSGLRATPEERLALGQDAKRIIHDDLVSGLMIGLVWLAICLTIGPPLAFVIALESHPHCGVEEMLDEWQVWLPNGLLGGLLFGMMLAVLFASLSAVASGRNAIASLLFGLSGIFPRRPARFLEWARNTGLLRVTGIAYQFRHDSYQQWLAGGGRNRDVAVRSGPPADAHFG